MSRSRSSSSSSSTTLLLSVSLLWDVGEHRLRRSSGPGGPPPASSSAPVPTRERRTFALSLARTHARTHAPTLTQAVSLRRPFLTASGIRRKPRDLLQQWAGVAVAAAAAAASSAPRRPGENSSGVEQQPGSQYAPGTVRWSGMLECRQWCVDARSGDGEPGAGGWSDRPATRAAHAAA